MNVRPSQPQRVHLNSNGLPGWTPQPVTKNAFDFPRAKEGQPDRMEFLVGARHPGKPKRLDRYLQERFPGYSRSFLQKMIKEERVLINGAVTKSSWHVTTGEQITMLLHKAGPRVAEEIPFEVLFEDDVLLALCKPSGVLVHPARGHKTGTLYNGLLHYYREHRAADPSFHIGTVHRLDEETSGVMVYALCKKAHKELTRQFENRLVKKTYLCLAHGRAEFTETDVDAPLGTDPDNRLAVAAFGLEPRSALTRFVRVAVSPCGNFSLLRAHPFTGRTHQIRVHAKHLGLPLVGDPLYGGRKEDPAFGGQVARVFLHAEALHLAHPLTQVPLALSAPPPPDLYALLAAMGLGEALK